MALPWYKKDSFGIRIIAWVFRAGVKTGTLTETEIVLRAFANEFEDSRVTEARLMAEKEDCMGRRVVIWMVPWLTTLSLSLTTMTLIILLAKGMELQELVR